MKTQFLIPMLAAQLIASWSALAAAPAFECKINVHSKAEGVAPDVWTSDHIPSGPGTAPDAAASVVKAPIEGLPGFHYAAILSSAGELEVYVRDERTLDNVADVYLGDGAAALSGVVDLVMPLTDSQKRALHAAHPDLAGGVTLADVACGFWR